MELKDPLLFLQMVTDEYQNSIYIEYPHSFKTVSNFMTNYKYVSTYT